MINPAKPNIGLLISSNMN